jgi:hypothetical protein
MTDYSKWFDENRNRWSWKPGMVDAVSGYRVYSVREGVVTGVIENTELGYGVYVRVVTDGIPDLHDPATRGCLMAQVREAAGYSGIYVIPPYLLSEYYDPKDEESRIFAALKRL